MADALTDAHRAALWRRQFEVYDDLVYGFLGGEGCPRCAARARVWHRRLRRWRPHNWGAWRWRFWHAVRYVCPAWPDWLERREREREVRAYDGRQAARRAGAADVTDSELRSARHLLSVPRFYGPLREEHFRNSDPLDEHYVGRYETSFVRTRRENEGEWA